VLLAAWEATEDRLARSKDLYVASGHLRKGSKPVYGARVIAGEDQWPFGRNPVDTVRANTCHQASQERLGCVAGSLLSDKPVEFGQPLGKAPGRQVYDWPDDLAGEALGRKAKGNGNLVGQVAPQPVCEVF
jgi:hypothetical protein